MGEEQAQADAQPTEAELNEQAEADFAAGYAGSDTPDDAGQAQQQAEQQEETKPAGDDQPTGEEAEQAAEAPEGEQEADEGDPLAGLGPSEVRALLAKASEVDSMREEMNRTRDTLFGKFGELNRTLQEIAQKSGAGKATEARQLTKDMFKRVAEDYGEDMAEALAEDLAGVVGGGEPVNLDERLSGLRDEITSEVERKFEHKNLVRQHKDFYDQVETPEFKLWLNRQPADDQKQFNESWDSDYLAGKMNEFKSWRKTLDKKIERQSRLEEAVQPKGSAAVDGGMSDQDAFEAGFYGR